MGIQAAAKKFKERKQKGKVISAASIAGHEGFPLLGLYFATKFAVHALPQAAAKELASAACDETVMTGMARRVGQRYREESRSYPSGACLPATLYAARTMRYERSASRNSASKSSGRVNIESSPSGACGHNLRDLSQ
jgi:short-subunit dehydrogenase